MTTIELPFPGMKSGIEGVLWLKPNVKRDGKYLFTEVNATLYRCTDGAVVWEAEGAGRWPQKDEGTAQTTATYVKEFGPDVETYAGPSFHLIKALLDQMPDPVLDERTRTRRSSWATDGQGMAGGRRSTATSRSSQQ